MKNKLLSMLLCLTMLLSACALCFTGCAPAEEDEEEEKVDLATTLVMWCVTEEGTDDEQAQAVAKAMSEKTQSEFKTKLLVKYFTLEEYYEQLEAAMEQLAKKAAEATDKDIMFIGHGDCQEDAEALAAILKERHGFKEVHIGYVGAVIGAHTGPGVLVAFFLGKNR